MNKLLVHIKKMPRQDWLALCELVVAVIMMLSLIQANKTLEYTRLQLDSAKQPSLDAAISEIGEIEIENTGGVEVEEIMIRGRIFIQLAAAEINRSEGGPAKDEYVAFSPKLSDAKLSADRLSPNQRMSVTYDQINNTGLSKDKEGRVSPAYLTWTRAPTAIALVIQYRRSSDKKLHHKVITVLLDNHVFKRLSDGSLGSVGSMKLLTIHRGTFVSSDTALVSAQASIRPIVAKAVTQHFDIHLSEETL